ncbi:MAG: response regulator [Actinobacteria bacterium]|nr:response regulator [Actinomycetota bacterium]
MKIVIIEDNPTNMKLAADVLKRSGYEVIEAFDADAGIALIRQHLPPLVLMDIQLPGMDGLTAARLLKGDEKTAHIKIVALTAFAMIGDRERFLEAGCDGYVSKPIRYKELLETVRSALEGQAPVNGAPSQSESEGW